MWVQCSLASWRCSCECAGLTENDGHENDGCCLCSRWCRAIQPHQTFSDTWLIIAISGRLISTHLHTLRASFFWLGQRWKTQWPSLWSRIVLSLLFDFEHSWNRRSKRLEGSTAKSKSIPCRPIQTPETCPAFSCPSISCPSFSVPPNVVCCRWLAMTENDFSALASLLTEMTDDELAQIESNVSTSHLHSALAHLSSILLSITLLVQSGRWRLNTATLYYKVFALLCDKPCCSLYIATEQLFAAQISRILLWKTHHDLEYLW